VLDPSSLARRRGEPIPEQPPVDLEIDTDHTDPRASAVRIVDHFALRSQVRQPRYASPDH